MLTAIAIGSACASGRAQIQYIVTISVDGLRSDAVTTLGPADAPNFYRLRNEGAFTDNARTDFDYTNTLPNHTSMLTGRRVATSSGHGWPTNGEPSSGQTIHNNKGSYVASAFDVVHDNGLRTALYSGKTKFILFARSYNEVHGALDITGPDNGRNKIDRTIINFDSEALTASFITGMETLPYHFSMLHFKDPDEAGHENDWDILDFHSPYLDSVRAVDSYIGMVLNSLETHPALAGRTALIVTSDHGGIQGTDNHIDAAHPEAYTVPFYAWGPGVPAGADLYAMNPTTRLDPGVGRPSYSDAIQPIRNADLANLALGLLGLPVVAGSTINTQQNLNILNPYPPGDYNYDFEVNGADYLVWREQYGSTGYRSADGNGDGIVNAADYTVWRNHAFRGGGSASSVATLPEPPVVGLLLAALSLFRLRGRPARHLSSQCAGLSVAVLFAALISVEAKAAVTYPGNGGTSFGGVLSNGSLTIDDLPNGTINFTFHPGSSFSRNLVIYIDSKPGGYANNYLMDYTPASDNQRAASGFNETTKVHALMQFPADFEADYAVALWVRANTSGAPAGSLRTLSPGTGADAGRAVLTNTTLINLSGAQTSPPTPVTFNFNATDIGLTPGAGHSFRFVATYLNGSNAVRSDEFIGGVAKSKLYDTNGNLASVTLADYRTYTLLSTGGALSSVPEPSGFALAVTPLALWLLQRRRGGERRLRPGDRRDIRLRHAAVQ
jgi:hypothetical protein